MNLEKAQKLIRNAWIAGIVSGTGTIIMMLIGMASKDIGYFTIVDVLLFYGLSFGIYKRSRACAIAMVVYFIFGKIDFIIRRLEDVMGSTHGMIFTSVAIAFLYFYSQGVRGTFVYHKLTNKIVENK